MKRQSSAYDGLVGLAYMFSAAAFAVNLLEKHWVAAAVILVVMFGTAFVLDLIERRGGKL